MSIGELSKMEFAKKQNQRVPMLIKTVLNRCHKFKSFVYQEVFWETIKGVLSLVVTIVPRANNRAQCSRCKRRASIYDRLPTNRDFQFVPLWGFPVYFRYRMRRVQCPEHGVVVESVPWAKGKSPLTHALELFLARWARRLSWLEVARCFDVSWHCVFQSVQSVVQFGLKHRNLENISAIGVDEIQYAKGHQYLTVVYQIDQGARRLLSVTQDRGVRSLLAFFRMFGPRRSSQIRFVCSDMWRPYLKVIKKKLPEALHVLDRFHIVANLNKALNEIRAAEARKLRQDGYEEVLKHTKYCFLKNQENLTPNQKTKLSDVLQYDLKSVRAYLLKESFQLFWNYTSPYWAEWYLKKWCARAMRSRLEPIKKFVKSLRRHQPLILNWFKAKKTISSGVVEGLNRKINLTTRKAYGFRNFEVLKTALYHTLGDLPEPEMTHRF